MTSEIAVYNPNQTSGPASIYDRMADPLVAAERLGGWIAKSKLIGVETVEQGIVVALSCMEERITPLEFARRYHVIKGRPSMRADYMQSAFQSAGGRVKWVRSDDDAATCTITHPEHAPEGFTLTVDLATLRQRKLTTDQYNKYPRQMLRARAVSEAIRAVMPSINAGHYAPEEQDDEPGGYSDAPRGHGGPQSSPEARPSTLPASEPQAPRQAPGLSDRAKAVIAAFKSKGVTLEQLEWFAGNGKEQIFALAWGEEEFKRFTKAKEQINASDLAGRGIVIQRLFAPGPEDPAPALEGPEVDPSDADPGEPPMAPRRWSEGPEVDPSDADPGEPPMAPRRWSDEDDG